MIVTIPDVKHKHYYAWLISYITGDMNKANELMNKYKNKIIESSLYLQKYCGINKRQIYRGVLLDPRNIDKHNLWKYPFVSFTDSIEVAKTFADINSIYSIAIKYICPHYIGKVITHKIKDEDFVWFDHQWCNTGFIHPKIKDFVKLWNQQEIILGRNIYSF